MNLQGAIRYFSRHEFEGWDKTAGAWVPAVTSGDFQAFDRFITARSFGQIKRNLVCPGELRIDPQFRMVRSPDGTRWMVESENNDADPAWTDRNDPGHVYSWIYQLHVADEHVQVVRYDEVRSASGYSSGVTERIVDDVWGNYERFGLTNSDEFERVVYTESLVTLPGDTQVNRDDQLRIGGRDYEVTEVFPSLMTLQVVANRRGQSPTLPDGSARP